MPFWFGRPDFGSGKVVMMLLMQLWVVVMVMAVMGGVICERGHWVRYHATCERTHGRDVVCVVDRVEGIHDRLLVVMLRRKIAKRETRQKMRKKWIEGGASCKTNTRGRGSMCFA
jgi:hypothetical protein